MNHPQLSVQPNAERAYELHRPQFLSQLLAPMDDMWAAFADLGAPFSLFVGEVLAGSCSVDGEGQLLRFFVLPQFSNESLALLELTAAECGVTHMMVSTADPSYLCPALDLAADVESHTLLFAQVATIRAEPIERLVLAELADLERVIEFQVEATGMPADFLQVYTRTRIELRELWLVRTKSQIIGVGELRIDQQQAGIAHLGVIVGAPDRRKGMGAAILCSLVEQCRELGVVPYCSTEGTNIGARRAIERAGFYAQHRLLRIEPRLSKAAQ